MKAKTIKAVLRKKHLDFLKSIDDENVRNVIDRKSIITGGAIASMLLNEKVNDYDYYFADKESAKIVAEYYVNKFKKLQPDSLIAPIVDEFTDFRGEERLRIFVSSSGFVAEGDELDFIDIDADEKAFDYDQVALDEEEKPEEKLRYRPVCLTSNAVSLSNGVQLIIRFFGEAEEIHSNYDFEHCKCWFRPSDGHLELPQMSLLCLLNKELMYSGSKYPLASIIRTRKFIRRGWQINAGQYVKMAVQLNGLDLGDVNVLEDQLIGVDVSYFMQVISQIKERIDKDADFNLTPDYLMAILDQIF